MKIIFGLCTKGLIVGIVAFLGIGITADNAFAEGDAVMLAGHKDRNCVATDSPTDLAIKGPGLFVLVTPQHMFFTRVGNFDFNSDGYLVSSHGYNVYGFPVSFNPDTFEVYDLGAMGDIRVSFLSSPIGPIDNRTVDRSSISIAENGIIYGRNGSDAVVPLYRIAIADFADLRGLDEVEADIFVSSLESGQAVIGYPGLANKGTIEDYALEQDDAALFYETGILVDGKGYIAIRDPASQSLNYYSDFNTFRFDRTRKLVTSGDLIAQGWALVLNDDTDEFEIAGNLTDILSPNVGSPPKATTHFTLIANIDKNSIDHATGENGLSMAWNGNLSLDQHIESDAYELHVDLTSYDNLGNPHEIGVYFDKADTDRTVEFIVTCSPQLDVRFNQDSASDAGHGLLGRGLLIFTAEGVLSNMTFERLVSSDPSAVGAWESQQIASGSGEHYTFNYRYEQINTLDQEIAIDFGASFDGIAWVVEDASTTLAPGISGTSSIMTDGYNYQLLDYVEIDQSGLITAHYCDGLTLPHFQLALVSFPNAGQLEKIGTNLYKATDTSGVEMTKPGENSVGLLSFGDKQEESGNSGGCFIEALEEYSVSNN